MSGGYGRPAPDASQAAEYLPLVRQVARRLGRRLPDHVGQDDLISAGVVGLLEAFQRYDPARPQSFATYAEFRVKGAILDELRRGDLMARDARRDAKELEATVGDLTGSLGRAPAEDELAQALGLSPTALRERLQRLVQVRICSLDEAALAPLAASTPGPLDAAERSQVLARLVAGIGRLTERQQQVLQLYYREELTMKEIGQVLAVTESRVCQIMAAATLQLRHHMRAAAPGSRHG